MAGKAYIGTHDITERISIYAANRRKSVRGWKYKKSRSAQSESCFQWSGALEKANTVVRSGRILFTYAEDMGKPRKRNAARSRTRNARSFADQEFVVDRTREIAVPGRALQRAEPHEPGSAESDRIYRGFREPVCWIDQHDVNNVQTNSVRRESHVLKCRRGRRRCEKLLGMAEC